MAFYTIYIEATIETEDEASVSKVGRYYDGQTLDKLPEISDHFGRLLILSVEGKALADEGKKLGADES